MAVQFKNFEDTQLQQILHSNMFGRLASRLAHEEQEIAQLGGPPLTFDHIQLLQEDLLGPTNGIVLEDIPAWQKLSHMPGLTEGKESIQIL